MRILLSLTTCMFGLMVAHPSAAATPQGSLAVTAVVVNQCTFTSHPGAIDKTVSCTGTPPPFQIEESATVREGSIDKMQVVSF